MLNETMEAYVIKRGNRWAKYTVYPLVILAFLLLRYDVLEDVAAVFGVIPLAFAFEPRSWTFKEDGSITYKDKKTQIVFRPVPLRKVNRKKGVIHIVFITGRILDFPISGLKRSEKESILAHMTKSLVR